MKIIETIQLIRCLEIIESIIDEQTEIMNVLCDNAGIVPLDIDKLDKLNNKILFLKQHIGLND